MDLLQIIKDKPVLSLGGAFLVVSAAIGSFLTVDDRYAHAKDVMTKAEVEKAAATIKTDAEKAAADIKVDVDKHAAEDKERASKQEVRDAWLMAGQAKTDATMARNRTNECLIHPPKTPLEMAACEQYRNDMVDANIRYQQAQETAKRASR